MPETMAGVSGNVPIRSVTAVVSAACNLSCRYCYQDRRPPGLMPWPVLRAAIDRLLASPAADRSLQFTGGEPLLAFPLIARAASYVDRACPRGREITFDVVTNGTLMRAAHIAFFAAREFSVQLSFDGVQAAQNLRGKGTFKRLDRLMDRLRRKEPRLVRRGLRVAVTITREAIPWLGDSVACLLEKGVCDIVLSPAMGPTIRWTAADDKAFDRQMTRIFDASLSRYRRTGRVPLLLFRKEADDPQGKPRQRFLCSAAVGKKVTVDVDGQAYTCPMLAESFQTFPDTPLRQRLIAMRLGDIRDRAFPDRLRGLPAAARRTGIFARSKTRHSSYGRCASCEFVPTCRACPMSVARDPEHTDLNRVPDYLCAFNRITLAHRARFPRQPNPIDVLTRRASFASLLGPLG